MAHTAVEQCIKQAEKTDPSGANLCAQNGISSGCTASRVAEIRRQLCKAPGSDVLVLDGGNNTVVNTPHGGNDRYGPKSGEAVVTPDGHVGNGSLNGRVITGGD